MITIQPDALTLILTLVAPVVVALVTKSHASARLKSAVLLVLTAAVTLLEGARTANGSAVLSTAMATQWAMNTAVSLASYLGLWKPVLGINDVAAPKVGISDRKDPDVDLEDQIG